MDEFRSVKMDDKNGDFRRWNRNYKNSKQKQGKRKGRGMMKKDIIVIDKMKKYLGKEKIIRGVNIEVSDGERNEVIGKNGEGK